MNDKRQFRVKSIYLRLLEIESPERREAYLDEQCVGDLGLQAEVRQLLGFQEKMGDFLEEQSHEPIATLIPPSRLRPPESIDAYKIREQIGEGGMGVIFVAEQTEPVRRKVALKLIKPGMDSKQVVARFETERQTLAMMSHPNIARVLDGGTTDDGRPYFVMELVKGIPITKFCDQQKLSTRERLQLMIRVCQAVQHAHLKGIIHRDLKPSNVMVELHDVEPVPKVIDFGIAKATGQGLTDHSVYTGFAEMIGTPLYMSPEQAQFSGLDVDTRSDIYSLGVMIYELVTGTTPFNREKIHDVNYEEIRRLIREQEAPRPSERVNTLKAEALSTVSVQRGVDARTLERTLRGELDWIVMKALEKDRNRRYETASALAADIERYLNNETVEACPPSRSYRLRKYARRNKAFLVTASLVAMSLLIGSGLSLWQASKANFQRREAENGRQEAHDQREVAQSERKRADEQRAAAQASLGKALEAVDKMLTRVGSQTLVSVPQMDAVRREVLRDALELCQALLEKNEEDPAVRRAVGNAYRQMGEIHQLLGAHTAAEESFQQAIAILDTSPTGLADMPARHSELSLAHYGLGDIYRLTGRFNEAETVLRRALVIRDKLAEEHPEVVEFQNDLAGSHNRLGVLYYGQGRLDEAETAYGKAAVIRSKLAEDHPELAEYQIALSDSHNNLGVLYVAKGRFNESVAAFERTLAIREKLVDKHPDVTKYQESLAMSLSNLANLYSDTSRADKAEAAYNSALTIQGKLTGEHPDVPEYQSALALSHNNLGGLYRDMGRIDEAESAYQAALGICSHEK